MKQIIKTVTFIAIILMAVSCKWTSTTETKSLQHQVNKDLYGYTTEELLDKLGQPTFIEKDTLEGIPVTMLRFEDKIVLQNYAHYAENYQTEDPYIIVFLKNGTAYSTKTNMVDTVISKDEKTISIIKLSTYAGILLLAIVLTFIALMLTRREKLKNLEEKINFLNNKANKNLKSIEDLYSKYKFLNNAKGDIYDEIRSLNKTITRMKERENAFNQHIDMIEADLYKEPKEEKTKEPKQKTLSFSEMGYVEKVELLAKRLDETGISQRAWNCLRAAEIIKMADLCMKSRSEIRKYRNFGRKSLAEIEELIEKYGLSFGMDLTEYGFEKVKTPFDEENNENETSEENSEGNLQEPETTGEAGQQPAEESIQEQPDPEGVQPSETPQA